MKLRQSCAVSHLPFSYQLSDGWIKPFVMGKDDAGLYNISERKAWSEGRAHYWFWKNWRFAIDECVSFQQYRRCFWFPQLVKQAHPAYRHALAVNKDLGQQIIHMSRQEYIFYVEHIQAADLAPLNHWLKGVDLVVSRAIQYPYSIAQIYGEHHSAQDWEIFAQACRARGLDDGRHRWLTGHLMFMMRPELFDEYMTAWWEIMSEVSAALVPNDDPYQHRQIGYLTERFMSAWLIKKRTECPTLRVQTLPICEGLFQFDRQPGMM